MIDLDTWIVSDTHFGHPNIIKYCNRPINHNEIMVEWWRDLIKRDDTVLHLGDLAVWFGETEDHWLRVAAGLNGQKYMLRGNHDLLADAKYGNLGFTVIPEFIQEFAGGRVLFSHYPDTTRLDDWDVNIHGHIHNNPYDPKYPQGRDYRNVSIEVMNYKPTRLRDLL